MPFEAINLHVGGFFFKKIDTIVKKSVYIACDIKIFFVILHRERYK